MAVFEWDGWVFDPAEWRLTSGVTGVVSLPNKSLELLALLLERAPGLVAKDDILSTVWRDAVVEEGNIAFHIAMLRRALDRPGGKSCIETVRGRGYRFIDPVTLQASAAEQPTAAPEPPRVETIEEPLLSPPVVVELPSPGRWRPAHVVPVVVIALGAGFMGFVAQATPPASSRAAASAAPVDPEVLALTLRARESWRLRTPPSVQQAVALYEQAIALDPSFPLAYAGLADCYNLTMSGLPTGVRATRAIANAERALALDPGLAEAHTALAFARYKFAWKWKEAEEGFRRAIAADPSYALAHHWYGEMLAFLGRHGEAITHLKQAIALDPSSLAIKGDLVPPLLRAGRVAEARAVLQEAAAINPTFHWIPRRMSEVFAAEGRERESLEEEWRALILSGATLESIEELRAAYRAGGRRAVLRLEIARLEAGEPGRFAVPQQATFLSSRYARLGERDKALQWIGVALDRREDAALHLLTHPDYDSLRGDPEFNRMLERVGLKAEL